MKKTFITGFILCFLGTFSSSLLAQDYKGFDLSTYYMPDIVRNQLGLSGSSNGSINNGVDDTNNSGIVGNINSSFNNYIITRKLVRNINAYLNLAGNTKTSDVFTTGLTSSSSNFNTYGGIGIDYHLFNSSKQFLSFGGNFNYAYNSSFLTNSDTLGQSDIGKGYNLGASIDLFVGAGLGRIENVTEAQQAVYLIDAFTKNNILNRDLTRDEIFNLAQEMSRTKNKRFLDARLHLMDEVSHIDSFFVSNNLIAKSDARYFTSLYDIWLYGDAFLRQSGQTIELKFSPYVSPNTSYSKNNQTINNISNSESSYEYLNTRYVLSLTYQYEKPVNQKWQESASVSLNGTLYNSTANEVYILTGDSISYKNTNQSASLTANYKLGFYPNTRTNLYAQISQQFSSRFYDSYIYNSYSQISAKISLISETNLEFGTYYYLSPQLRLSAALKLSNYYSVNNLIDNSQRNKYLNGNYSISLSYSFF